MSLRLCNDFVLAILFKVGGRQKLLNIEVIGFKSVQSEKVGEQPSTPEVLPPHYHFKAAIPKP
jgi:hypothetical protein